MRTSLKDIGLFSRKFQLTSQLFTYSTMLPAFQFTTQPLTRITFVEDEITLLNTFKT